MPPGRARGAAKLLLLTSAVHGVEGYGGSGAQTALLHDSAWMEHSAFKTCKVACVSIATGHQKTLGSG
ncbi:MAG: M14 family metallopeptidase [Pseudomonadota bacterium]|nr:M14 family metallopeptidase [Pseudomonadota bacterium]